MPTSEQHDLLETVQLINVPSYVVDRNGTIRWINDAARRLVGDVTGRKLADVVAPEYRSRAEEQFARKLRGTPVTDFEVELVDAQGRRVLTEISSVPLQNGGHIVGVFGLAQPVRVQRPTEAASALTPRQMEVLRLLAEGARTDQIAAALHVSRETVRNHVRNILRALGAHSRLEAVAVARRAGLLD